MVLVGACAMTTTTTSVEQKYELTSRTFSYCCEQGGGNHVVVN